LERAPFPEAIKTAYTDAKVKGKAVLQSQARHARRRSMRSRRQVARMALIINGN
jgi:hypothetical protein